MTIDERLEELGIELPPIPAPAGNYVHAVRTGNLLYLAGKGPGAATGKVGAGISVEEAYGHAREVGLVLISVMRDALGSLDRVSRIVKVLGMVNAVPEFGQDALYRARHHHLPQHPRGTSARDAGQRHRPMDRPARQRARAPRHGWQGPARRLEADRSGTADDRNRALQRPLPLPARGQPPLCRPRPGGPRRDPERARCRTLRASPHRRATAVPNESENGAPPLPANPMETSRQARK